MLQKFWDRLKKIGQKKGVILMYHHVCERKSDPWQLAVHPENFELQLNYLKKNFDVVSIEEMVHCVAKKKLRKNMLAITFDDGFIDNYTTAAPLLEWYKLPATFYLATHPLKNQKFYWWDELQSIILHTEHLPLSLELKVGIEQIKFTFRRHQILNTKSIHEINTWSYGMKVPNERIALYIKLWQNIQPLSQPMQNAVLEQLRIWSGLNYIQCKHGETMQVYQMLKLSRNKLFSMGSHTVTHSMLGEQKEDDQRFEIRESKRVIESLLGKNVNGFAYPYGNYNAATKTILQDAGFHYAVSTECRAVTIDSDPFELPRVQVKNWSIEEFAAKIHQFLN